LPTTNNSYLTRLVASIKHNYIFEIELYYERAQVQPEFYLIRLLPQHSPEAEVLKIALSTSNGGQLWLLLKTPYFSFSSLHNSVMPNGSGKIHPS
jgi:hypothetical protein